MSPIPLNTLLNGAPSCLVFPNIRGAQQAEAADVLYDQSAPLNECMNEPLPHILAEI